MAASSVFRRMTAGDLLALAIACTAILASVVAARVPRETLASTPLCWSVILLHRECPGCGLTRSFAAIGRGAFAEANALNPLGPVLFTWAAAVIAVRAGKLTVPRFPYWLGIDMALAATAVLLLITHAALFYLG